MAMLAEPRRKQKIINLRAKNNAWSNDNSKFGQRMLEKMGWSSGKGLGVHENGITEHVVARYKNDEKGLGFEDKNDQWTKHEDDFNALLANLSNASDNSDNLHSGVSLEDKSKKSKARIHYHKFTRGKDISRYSEKDLANIFGKKSFKNTEVVEKSLKEELKTTEQIFTEKGSMEDYFKNKLDVIRSKSTINVCNIVQENSSDEPSYTFLGFSQEGADNEEISYKGLGVQDNFNCKEDFNLACNSQTVKKKKKSKKLIALASQNECSSDTLNSQENIEENIDCTSQKKIKKKKNSINKIDTVETTCINMLETTNGSEDSENVAYVHQIFKKKRKKNSKNTDVNNDLLPSANNSFICDNDKQDLVKLSKKKKKSKYPKEQSEGDIVDTNIVENVIIQKCKRKNSETFEDTLKTIKVPKKKRKRRDEGN